MRQRAATMLGFFLAPLAAAMALVAAEVVRGKIELLGSANLGWVLVFYFYALSATLVIGLPAYLLIRRFAGVTWWSAALTGVLCGAVMTFIFDSLEAFLIVPIGGVSALVFWLIWRSGKNPGESGTSIGDRAI